jgi:hypothetical protein
VQVVAAAGDGEADVSWDAPSPDDPSITGYTITVSPGDVSPVSVSAAYRSATISGLYNGTWYTFTVTASNDGGLGTPSGPSAEVTPHSPPPTPTSLRLSVSRHRVLSGVAVWLGGALRDNAGHGLAGETVVVEQRRRGAGAWGTLTTRITGSGGTVPAVRAVPGSHMHYRLRHAASPRTAPSASGLAVIMVGVRISVRLSAGRIRLGRTTSMGGAVVPAHHGQLVALQRKTAGGWRTVQRVRLAGNGRFSFTIRPRAAGTSWWRVSKAGDGDHLGATTGQVRLVVTPKPKPKAKKAKPKPKKPKKSKPKPKNCDPAYPDVCLHDGIGDYDCPNGKGNGPNYVPVDRPIKVKAPDPFKLDGKDHDGWGCEG